MKTYVCTHCWRLAEPGALLCPCGSINLIEAPEPPSPQDPEPDWPYPWTAVVRMPAGSILLLSGPPGGGKSSLAALPRPRWWLTTEETVPQAKASVMRMQGVQDAQAWPDAPEIVEICNPVDLADTLAWAFQGLVVLDSITQIGSIHAQQDAFNLLESWVRASPGRRVCCIAGYTKAQRVAGKMSLAHQAQIWCDVQPDATGLRRLTTHKNRHGPLASRYFALGPQGVQKPAFPYAYSVEGAPGAYDLVPWPSRGTQWAGILDARFKAGDVQTGIASAGKQVKGYPGGVQLPQDIDERRRFAAEHGLQWLD